MNKLLRDLEKRVLTKAKKNAVKAGKTKPKAWKYNVNAYTPAQIAGAMKKPLAGGRPIRPIAPYRGPR